MEKADFSSCAKTPEDLIESLSQLWRQDLSPVTTVQLESFLVPGLLCFHCQIHETGDWPLQLLSPHLHGGVQQTQFESFVTYILAFCPLVARPWFCLPLQAGLSQAFVLCLQAQNPGSVKDSSLKTETSFAQENKGLLNLLFEDTLYSLIDMYALPFWNLNYLPSLINTVFWNMEFSLKSCPSHAV